METIIIETPTEKKCTKCAVVKPFSEFASDKYHKSGKKSACKACKKLFQDANREKYSATIKSYYKRNVARILEYSKEYEQENKERIAERKHDYYLNNIDNISDTHSRYRLLNKHRAAAAVIRRKASKLRATALWANQCAITLLYKKSAELFEQTGIKYHVDHIVPLMHPLVCGLHWEGNLQVITAKENLEKSNKFTPGFYPLYVTTSSDSSDTSTLPL